MWIKLLVCIVAGTGAGVGTGLAGLSAAAVISPMLISFLGVPAYQAVGIGLASDVLASAASAYTYGKNKNLDIRNGLVMLATVLVFTAGASFAASLLPDRAMGNFSMSITLLIGIKLLVRPVMTTKDEMVEKPPRTRVTQSILGGAGIGVICGLFGAGGGMMMLFVLTSILGYELKTAVGTSVFIMAFTALTGSVSHFVIGGMPDAFALTACVITTLAAARVAAVFANKAEPKTLNQITGIVLCVLGAALIVFHFVTR